MEFIGAYWWLWLVLMVVFIGYASYNQINRIMGMKKKGFDQSDMDGAFQAFGSGIKGFVISFVLGGIATVLLLLSVVINLIAFSH
ncbi:MAG: hypothetical protein NTX00_01195 [Candidatus Parcubacteria bacterium]|nr:hypothetical protein [Candidatus Parcubacteria bacterium]